MVENDGFEHVAPFVDQRFKSDIQRRKHKANLAALHAFLIARGKTFYDANFTDLAAWLQEIDAKNILPASKERFRRIATQFLTHLKKRLHLRVDVPVPDRDELWWTEKDRRDEKERIPLDKASALRILEHFQAKDLELYIGTRLFFETGMRVGELVQIKHDGIDLDARRIYTKGKMGLSRYFFPAKFRPDLAAWLRYQKELDPELTFIFPAMFNRTKKHASDAFFRDNLRDARDTLGLQCSCNPHAWRDLINSERVDKYKLNPELTPLLSILLCQVPTCVNAAHYMKRYDWKNPFTEAAHRELYDTLYPW